MEHTFKLIEPDHAAERSMDFDVDMHNKLGAINPGAPTLLDNFLSDDSTFAQWFPDAAIGGNDEMAFTAMRPLFDNLKFAKDNYREGCFSDYQRLCKAEKELSQYFYGLVMAFMETASEEAQ